MLDRFSVKHSVPVLSLPIKNTLDRFTFGVFLVVMAAHTIFNILSVLYILFFSQEGRTTKFAS
jgi:hypothetical protein